MMKDFFTRIRPQVMVAIILLAMIVLYALNIGHEQIAGIGTTGIVGFGTRLIDKE